MNSKWSDDDIERAEKLLALLDRAECNDDRLGIMLNTLAGAEMHARVSTDIHTRLATLSKRVLDRLRAADGFTTVGSLYDEDFAGDVAQLRQAIEDYENG